ncbi:MAG: transketolase [Spirochaetales bacterium]|jgi:transketolase|nr:transketolase [Spirochaetales bacterium]
MGKPSIKELEYTAALCRRKVLRMIEAGHAGHMGGAMSCIDIVAALYFYVMRIDPRNPKMPGRDRFILSAGHKCMAQYAVLCQRGFFDEAVLDSYGSLNSKIPGHPDMYKLPGVEANTGALGHGLSIGLGMALGLRMDGEGARTFVVMGDGELAEGSNWEAAAAAAQFKADNLVVFVDCNGLQISGKTVDIMNMNPVERFAAFGWAVKEIDGNSMSQITAAVDAVPFAPGKPSLIAAHTLKARGICFAEGIAKYHYWKPSAEELNKAIAELDKKIEEVQP